MTTGIFPTNRAYYSALAAVSERMARLSVTNQEGSVSQIGRFFQQTLSEQGLEANRSVFKSSRVDEDTRRLFSVGEDSCEEGIQLKKITLHYLMMERYVIEQYTKIIAVDDAYNHMAEELLSQGARFVPPTKDPHSLASCTPIPMVSQNASLPALALECQLQRILALSVKNQYASESSLRNTVKKIAALWRLSAPDSPCVAELISISRYLQSQLASSQTGESSAVLVTQLLPCLCRLKEKKLLLSHMELFSPLERCAPELELNTIIPSEEEIASGNLTDYVRRKIAISKKATLTIKEIVANYDAVRKQRAAEYASIIKFFKTRRLYTQIHPRGYKIIPVSDFEAPFLTPPTQFLIDQELFQPTEAAPSTLSGYLPVGLRKPPRQTRKSKKERAPQAEPEQKTPQHTGCRKEEAKPSIRISFPPQPEASSRAAQSSSGKRKGKAPMESTPSAPSQAVGSNAASKFMPKLQYHWHVRRWFDPESDPMAEDEVYKGYREDVQKLIRLEHSFSPLMHQYILERGKCFVEAGKEKPTHRYTMLGEMYDGKGFSKKGVFTIAVNEEGLIYHAFFTRKTEDELCKQYRDEGFFKGKDVERVVSDRGRFFLPEDGSSVVQDDGDLVVVQDKVHNLFLAAYNLQDPLYA